MEEELMNTWVNYGIVIRLPFKDIHKIIEFCKDNDIRVIYNKASLSHLLIKELPPSGNSKDDTE